MGTKLGVNQRKYPAITTSFLVPVVLKVSQRLNIAASKSEENITKKTKLLQRLVKITLQTSWVTHCTVVNQRPVISAIMWLCDNSHFNLVCIYIFLISLEVRQVPHLLYHELGDALFNLKWNWKILLILGNI